MPKCNFEKEYALTFIGRDAELKWLDDRLFRRDYSSISIIISGAPGVGKTSLIRHWLSSRRISYTPVWLDLSLESNNDVALDNFIIYLSKLNEDNFPNKNRLIVVIDGSDIWSENQHSEASGKVLNYKMVSSLLTKQKPVKSPAQ